MGLDITKTVNRDGSSGKLAVVAFSGHSQSFGFWEFGDREDAENLELRGV